MWQLTTILTAAALLLPAAAPAAGQEGADTTTYEGTKFPVWVTVEDVEGDAGAHEVYVEVAWDDYRSALPFAREIEPGDLTVFLPKTEDADDVDPNDACRFTSTRMEHGSTGARPAIRRDADCLAPPAASLPLIGIEYTGAPVPMACTPATRTDGTEDPAIRYFACYYSAPPGEGRYYPFADRRTNRHGQSRGEGQEAAAPDVPQGLDLARKRPTRGNPPMSAEKDLVKAGGSLMAAGCLWMLLLPVLVAWSCEEPGARRAREVTGRKPAIVFAVTLAGGCATAAQTYDFDPVQSFTRPKAEVWQALVDVVTARGWPVRVIETDAGFLAVNELPLRESRVDCGKLGILAYWRGPPTGTVDMHVRDESDGTAHLRVTINASRMASVSGSTVVQTVLCNSRGELEGEVAREVRAKLEGRGTAPGLSSS